MWTSTRVVDVLRERGELWESRPGLVSLRGNALALLRSIEGLIAAITRAEGLSEWRLAPGLDLGTLARADYFASFPQWLTAAGHLGDDETTLESVARSDDPARAASEAMGDADCALSPALCYHTFARLADTTIDTERMTAHGTCWRHEGDRLRALERGWAFTMRELVHVGRPEDVRAFCDHGMELGVLLAETLRLDHGVVPATDPFFAPTARGKELLQRVKGLKHELVLPLGASRSVAAASFNDHERFFGEAFEIRTRDGVPASSGCVAFGVERWLLAFLVAHGPDAAGWPAFESEITAFERSVR